MDRSLEPDRPALTARFRPYLLALPAFVLVAGLLAALAMLFVESLRPAVDASGAGLVEYQRVLGTPLYAANFTRSFALAAWATAATLALGYPVAYELAHAAPRPRRAIYAFLVLTFFSDYVLRMFGLVLVLGPLHLVFNRFGVVVGLVSAALPFAIIVMAGVIGRIDPSQVAAARLLGASPWRAFRHVTLPLSMPGVVGAGAIVFLLSLNSFITPALLGGGFVNMIATFIYTEALGVYNLPLGAAAAFILLALSLALLACVNALFGRFGERFGVRSGR